MLEGVNFVNVCIIAQFYSSEEIHMFLIFSSLKNRAQYKSLSIVPDFLILPCRALVLKGFLRAETSRIVAHSHC